MVPNGVHSKGVLLYCTGSHLFACISNCSCLYIVSVDQVSPVLVDSLCAELNLTVVE